jgi:hypothetical protein
MQDFPFFKNNFLISKIYLKFPPKFKLVEFTLEKKTPTKIPLFFWKKNQKEKSDKNVLS